jgi:acid phosphatase
MRKTLIGALLGLGLLAQAALAEPAVLNADQTIPNLGAAKIEIREYVSSGRYQHELAEVAGRARAYLELNLPRFQGKKPAMVLDIDETSVTNWEQIDRSDFGYQEEQWDSWIAAARAPALASTLELFEYARSNGVAVFFITAREESERSATARLLSQAGYDGYQELVLKTNGDHSSSATYKSGARRRITEQGYSILVNVGDQQTDLDGGYAEASFKLPNPMYLVP